jgi:hypothetical protein
VVLFNEDQKTGHEQECLMHEECCTILRERNFQHKPTLKECLTRKSLLTMSFQEVRLPPGSAEES